MGYLDIAYSKRQQRQQQIPEEWLLEPEFLKSSELLAVPKQCGKLTNRELSITEQHDAVCIVQRIADGTYSAKEVTVAFCKRAAIAQQLVSSSEEQSERHVLKMPDELPH